MNQSKYDYDMYYTMGYDAVLAIALTLNKSIDVLQARGKILENFTYSDKETAALFKTIMYSLSFDGMTVRSAKCIGFRIVSGFRQLNYIA